MNLREVHQIELQRPKGSLVDEVPDKCWNNADWYQELKYDGLRQTFQIDMTERNWLVSRSRHDKTKGVAKSKSQPFVESCKAWPWLYELQIADLNGTLLDCELIWPGHGASEISTINPACQEESRLIIFDCLFFNGVDMRDEPYTARRMLAVSAQSILDRVIKGRTAMSLQFSSSKEEYDRFVSNGAEGTILKNINATYMQSCSWYKAKSIFENDCVILGVTEAKGNGSPTNGIKPTPIGKAANFIIGLFIDGKLKKVGHAGFPPDTTIDLSEVWVNREQYRGRIVEVEYSGFDGRSYRWARVRRLRQPGEKSQVECIPNTARQFLISKKG